MSRVLVTGSTDGIGLRTAQIIAERGHDVIVHGRDPERVAAAAESVGAVASIAADYRDLGAVERMAEKAAETPIDVLINNAGIYERDLVRLPAGESMWVVNHLAQSLLTDHVIAAMLTRGAGRVINVSTIAHGQAHIDLDDPNFEHREWDHAAAYGQSKLANLLMARETARRLGPDSLVLVNALHPGVVATKMLTQGFQMPGRDSLDVGAATAVFLALDAPATRGEFYVRSSVKKPMAPGRDDEMAAALYDYTVGALGL